MVNLNDLCDILVMEKATRLSSMCTYQDLRLCNFLFIGLPIAMEC